MAESAGREVQIGGPDVLSYGEMLDEMARVLGLRPRRSGAAPFGVEPMPLRVALRTAVDEERGAAYAATAL